MAIEDRVSSGASSSDVGQIQRYASTVAWLVAVAGVVLAWLAFRGIVVRLHVQTGDCLSAGLVVGFS